VVELRSADDTIYVNNQEYRPTGKTRREFLTPPLEPGRRYAYVVRVEASRDGEPMEVGSRRVVFRAGEQAVVSFTDAEGQE
jgi:uncharacterized protein (TIGR03000 family)